MNRDFKGVWIPKEIWLSKELTLLEKCIFTEIDSLDNEDHCYASNEYFSEFCNCSISSVTRTIKRLTELGMIEVINFDGRQRVIKVVTKTSQNDEAESAKCSSINLENKKSKKESNSKELLQNSEKPKKKNLFEKCLDIIDEYTEDGELKDLLVTYLKYRLEIKDKPLYANMWKGMINKLRQLDNGDYDTACAIVQQSINRGYLGFFPVNTYSNYSKSSNLHDKINESGVTNVPHITEAEERELERMIESGELQEY